MKKIILTIIVLILIILGFTPWVTGYLFRNRYLELIDILNQKNPHLLTVTSYRLGWFSSEVELIFRPFNAAQLKRMQKYDLPPELSDIYTLTIKEHISHGPIVFDKARNRPAIALATLHGEIHLPDKVDILLFGKVKPEGIGTFDTLATFGGTWREHVVMNPLVLLPQSMFKATWDGLQGDITLSVKNNVVQKVKTKFTLGRVFVGPKENAPIQINLLLQPITQSSQTYLQPVGLWAGQATLTAPGFSINNANRLIFSFESLTMAVKSAVTNNLYSINNQISVQKIEMPDSVVPLVAPLNLQIDISGVNAPKLYDLTMQYTKVRNQQMSPDEFQDELPALLVALLTQNTDVKLNLAGSTSMGDFSVKANANWPENTALPKTADEFYAKAHAKIDIRMSAALETLILNQVIAQMAEREAIQLKRMNMNGSSSVNTPTNQEATTPQKDIFKKAIADLMQQGKLALPAAIQIMTWFDQHISPAEFGINVKQLNLSPEAEKELNTLYQQLYLVKTAQPAQPSVATATPQPTPPVDEAQMQQQLATTMRTQFDELVQQGYIIQEGNDYLISITIDNGSLKINDKPLPSGMVRPTGASTSPEQSPLVTPVQTTPIAPPVQTIVTPGIVPTSPGVPIPPPPSEPVKK